MRKTNEEHNGYLNIKKKRAAVSWAKEYNSRVAGCYAALWRPKRPTNC